MLRIPSQALRTVPTIRSVTNPLVKNVVGIHKMQNSSQSPHLLIQSPYMLFSLYDIGYRFDYVFLNRENIEKMIKLVDDKVVTKGRDTLPPEVTAEPSTNYDSFFDKYDKKEELRAQMASQKKAAEKKAAAAEKKAMKGPRNPIEEITSSMSFEQAQQWLGDILEMLDKKMPVHFCPEPVLEKMANLPSSSGYLAVMRKPQYSFERLVENTKIRKIIICDRVVDPGNMGTIIRNAVAYGYDAIITTPDSVHVYNDKVIRSSAGAVFKIPIVEGVETQKIIDNYVRRANSYTAFVATSDRFDRVWDISNDKDRFVADMEKRQLRHLVWLSNETQGISNELNQLIPRGIGKRKSPYYNRIVEVNIDTRMESINVSVASGIIMHKLREYLEEADKKLDILGQKNAAGFVPNNRVDFFELDEKPLKKAKSTTKKERTPPKKLAGRVASTKLKQKYKLTVQKEPQGKASPNRASRDTTLDTQDRRKRSPSPMKRKFSTSPSTKSRRDKL